MKMKPIHERVLEYAHTRDGMTGEPILEQTFRDDMRAAADALLKLDGVLRLLEAHKFDTSTLWLDGAIRRLLTPPASIEAAPPPSLETTENVGTSTKRRSVGYDGY